MQHYENIAGTACEIQAKMERHQSTHVGSISAVWMEVEVGIAWKYRQTVVTQ